jgi:membrane protein
MRLSGGTGGWQVPRLVAAVLREPRLRRTADLLLRSFHEFRADHCQQMAAAISYHVLFSVFPLAITAAGVVGLITQSPHARDTVVNVVLRAVPLSQHGRQQLTQLLTSAGGRSAALGLFGIAGVVWSATGVMAAIRTALNVAWDTSKQRPFLRGKAIDLLLMAATVLIVGASFGLTFLTSFARHGVTHLPGVLRFLDPLGRAAASAAGVVGSVALLFATFAFLYRVVPAARTRVRDVWPGALTAAVGFEATEYGFSVFISHFSHYSKVYGSLGTVIAFLFFVYLVSMVFLFGAEVASEYPRCRTERALAGGSEPGPGGPAGASGNRAG